MLAAWLVTVTWICLVASIVGHTIWVFTDGRRPEMPREVYENMIAGVGTMILGPIVILLGIYLPDRITAFAGLFFLGLTFSTAQQHAWPSGYEKAYPMTAAWQAAARRSTQLGRLFVASVGAFILIGPPEDIAICGLGAVAAMNLHHLKASIRDKSLGFMINALVALPFLISFVAYLLSLPRGLLEEGLNLSYSDLSLQVHAPIPGDDPDTVFLLQNYICLMLLFYFLNLIAELVVAPTRWGGAFSPRIFLALRLLRVGIASSVFVFLLPDYPAFSAQLVKYLLYAVEFAACFAPLPDIPVPADTTQQQGAANPA